jgi:hypothetical protein
VPLKLFFIAGIVTLEWSFEDLLLIVGSECKANCSIDGVPCVLMKWNVLMGDELFFTLLNAEPKSGVYALYENRAVHVFSATPSVWK